MFFRVLELRNFQVRRALEVKGALATQAPLSVLWTLLPQVQAGMDWARMEVASGWKVTDRGPSGAQFEVPKEVTESARARTVTLGVRRYGKTC